MNITKRLIAVTVAGLSALAVTAPATTTAALPRIACAYPTGLGPEPVRLSAPTSFDFGDGDLVGNEPSSCGRLTWDLSDPTTITPRLTGTLFAKNGAGSQVRMAMVHRDVHGTEIGSTRGGTKYIDTNDVVELPITLGGNDASPSIYQVDVELQQRQGTSGPWVVVAMSSHHLGSPTLAPDDILLLGGPQSFGARPYASGAPSGPGTLAWELTASGVRPHLTGDLFLRNSANTPTRLRMTYVDVFGHELSQTTTSYETAHNGIVRIPVDWTGPASPYLYRVEVELEVGTWSAPVIAAGPVSATI